MYFDVEGVGGGGRGSVYWCSHCTRRHGRGQAPHARHREMLSRDDVYGQKKNYKMEIYQELGASASSSRQVIFDLSSEKILTPHFFLLYLYQLIILYIFRAITATRDFHLIPIICSNFEIQFNYVFRHAEIITKDNMFGQITVRFHSQQSLAIYDR